MCKKATLRLTLSCFNGLVLVSGLVSLGLGVWLFLDGDGQTAYGGRVRNWASGLMFNFLASLVGAYFGMYGTVNHNKFALSVALVCVLFIGAVSMFNAVVILISVQPKYDADTAAACVQRPLTVAPLDTSSTCYDFFTELGNRKMFRLWLDLYQRSFTEPETRAFMDDLEDSNFCCGWGPPLQCVELPSGGESWPERGDDLLLSDRPATEALSRCSLAEGYYPPVTGSCDVVPPSGGINNGCPYMFSIRSGCANPSSTQPACADVFQLSIRSRFVGVATGALLIFLVMTFAALGFCCYCFKRKSTDVLPPFKPFADDRFEKYRNGVPKKQQFKVYVSNDESDTDSTDSDLSLGSLAKKDSRRPSAASGKSKTSKASSASKKKKKNASTEEAPPKFRAPLDLGLDDLISRQVTQPLSPVPEEKKEPQDADGDDSDEDEDEDEDDGAGVGETKAEGKAGFKAATDLL